MATSSSLPSSPAAGQQGTPVAPPNFYAQAATAQPPAKPAQANQEDTKKFRDALGKLLGNADSDGIFSKLEKLKPNGINIEKKIKAIAQSFRDLRNEIFEGDEGEGESDSSADSGKGAAAGADQTNASSPPPATPGGAAGTGV